MSAHDEIARLRDVCDRQAAEIARLTDYERISDLRTRCETLADGMRAKCAELAQLAIDLAKLGNYQAKFERLQRDHSRLSAENQALKKQCHKTEQASTAGTVTTQFSPN